MIPWLNSLVLYLVSKLGAWLLARAIEQSQKIQAKTASDKEIDSRLQQYKDAYKEAFNGEAVTPEQRKKLNGAIADFIRGPSGNGM